MNGSTQSRFSKALLLHRRGAALRWCFLAMFAMVEFLCPAAQTEAPAGVSVSPTNAIADVAPDESRPTWSFNASASYYIVPQDRDFIQPTFSAARGWLHMEARYNYEYLETGSAWIGYNFAGGEKLEWEVTPMLGGVFGETSGVASGCKGSLSWWKLELYVEAEYVWDARDSSDSFFYNWSELSVRPLDWLRVGVVTQRTRAYKSDREIQRGFLAGFSYKGFDLTAYVFNPDDGKPISILAFAASF